MNFNDDDELEDDFIPDDDFEDGDEWKLKPVRENAKELTRLANQILKTTEAIVETLPEEDTEDELTGELRGMQEYRSWMMENALKIRVKISGAMATGDYILMSENATIIKLAARELMTQTSGLKMFGYDNHDYLNALRAEIEEFRKVFVRWVRSFPKEDPLWPDGWGLFYTDEDVEKWNRMNPTEPREE
ncbi:MAG TPA: hypothetical protein PLW44_03490 [Chitinophagales bacterium]|nr:hypothetical protein [Chitinophagales bacterium]